MMEEIHALQKRDTWAMVPHLNKASNLGSRWVYKLKTNFDGSIAQFKAQLVA